MSVKHIVIGAAAVVGVVVLWRILRGPLAEAAGGLVAAVGGKPVADAALRETLGPKEYAKVIAMRGQTEVA